MGNSLAKQARQAAATNDVPRLTQIVSSTGGQEALLQSSWWKQRTPLHAAARGGCAEALAAVIEVAAHATSAAAGETMTGFLNSPDQSGDTALALACKHGHADCLRELLEAGASPLPANRQGATALHQAAMRGHAACLRLLLATYVRLPDGIRGRAADAVVPDVIDTERYIDARTHGGLCALHLAVLSGSLAAVQELVGAGAQLDTPMICCGARTLGTLPPCLAAGSTALHMAAATGRASLVAALLHAQQQRHPGLELRRMRNARGMTPLNVALLCGFGNMAALLAAGAPVPAPAPAARSRALPPLLRQQMLALVHRAALLSQLRELGLGSAAAAGAPRLPSGPVARLETLLHSDAATPGQVLAAVDELLEDAAAAGYRSGNHGGRGGAAAATNSSGSGTSQLQQQQQRGRRRQRRQAAERDRVARQLAALQAGADWTLLERSRSLWHLEHGGSSLYRRLHRRHERQQAAAGAPLRVGSEPAADAAGEAGSPHAAHEGALLLADALLGEEQAQQQLEQQLQQQQAREQQQQQQEQSSSRQPSRGSSLERSSGSGSGSSDSGASSEQQQEAQADTSGAAAACAAGPGEADLKAAKEADAEAAVCPVCLDLPADVAVVPCGHRACLHCCGRLASYTATGGSFGGLPLQSPLCPLCRAAIEAFRGVTC